MRMQKYYGDAKMWTHPLVKGSGRHDEDIITARILALQSGGVPDGGVNIGGVDLNHIGDVRKFLLAMEGDPSYDTVNPWSAPQTKALYRGDRDKEVDFRKGRNNSDLISTTYNHGIAKDFASSITNPLGGIVRKWEDKDLPLSTVVDVKRAWRALPETNEMMKYLRELEEEEEDMYPTKMPGYFPSGPKEWQGVHLIPGEGEVLVKNSDFMKWNAPWNEVGKKRPRADTSTG